MDVLVSSHFLLGVIVGAALLTLAQPLFRSLGSVTRFLPLFLLMAALLFALYFWIGR